MGVSIEKELGKNWEQITGLVEDTEYSLQNVNTKDLFLRDAPTVPDPLEIGNRLEPSKTARIIQEAGSLIWIRSQTAKGIAFYNSVP